MNRQGVLWCGCTCPPTGPGRLETSGAVRTERRLALRRAHKNGGVTTCLPAGRKFRLPIANVPALNPQRIQSAGPNGHHVASLFRGKGRASRPQWRRSRAARSPKKNERTRNVYENKRKAGKLPGNNSDTSAQLERFCKIRRAFFADLPGIRNKKPT